MYANQSTRNGANRGGFLAIMLASSLLAPAALSRGESVYTYTEARVESPPGTAVCQDMSEASGAQYAECQSTVQYGGQNEMTATAVSQLDAPNGVWRQTSTFRAGHLGPGFDLVTIEGERPPGTEGLTCEINGEVTYAKFDWWRVYTFNRPGNFARSRFQILLDGITIFEASAELDQEGNVDCGGFFEPEMFNVWLDGDLWIAEYVGPAEVVIDLPSGTPMNLDVRSSVEVRLSGPFDGVLPESGQDVSLELGEGGSFELSEFHEDFDSYDTCRPLPEQSSWEPWDGNPAKGDFYATHARSRSGPTALAIDFNDGAVHRFNGFTEGLWELSAWMYVPEEMVDWKNYVVLNTYPAEEDCHTSLHLKIKGDIAVISDLHTGDELPLVKGDWSEVKVVIDLDADEQTVYYNGDLLVTKSWTAGVDEGGALNIAAIDLWAGYGDDIMYYDDISLKRSAGAPCPADINGDGVVNTADLLALLGAWGACP
jgi:hypothetical protein